MGAGNLVGHQLHDSGAVGQHHVEVCLDFYNLGFLSMEPIFHTWFSINSLTWLIFPWRAARTSGVSPLMFRESTSTWFFSLGLFMFQRLHLMLMLCLCFKDQKASPYAPPRLSHTQGCPGYQNQFTINNEIVMIYWRENMTFAKMLKTFLQSKGCHRIYI